MYFYDQAGMMAMGSRLRRLADILMSDAKLVYDSYGVDIDPRWLPVFYTLTLKGEASVSELAQDTGRTHAAVSQVVNKMVRDGFATTARCCNDSRRTMVSLTESGKAQAELMQSQLDDVRDAAENLVRSVGLDFWDRLQAVEDELEQRGMAERVLAVRKARESRGIRIVPFDEKYATAFRALNLDWIEQFFEPESSDYKVLDNPVDNIIDKGGYIAFALDGDRPVGTCALIRLDDDNYELAKMAVADEAKGKGIGMLLGEHIVARAREAGAHCLCLESNTSLKPAINLYRKLGFKRVPQRSTPYARCNIQMELRLD